MALLRELGVRRFSALPYAHKPGVAAYLNDWARQFATDVPESLWSATFYPEPEAAAYVGELVDAGSRCSRSTSRSAPSGSTTRSWTTSGGGWSRAARRSSCTRARGRCPTPSRDPGRSSACWVAGRGLAVVVAHLGAPEYVEFLELAERFERVYLDTTMAFTDFFEQMAPYPTALLPRLADLGEKVLLGSDFPTIPYPYLHQLESLERLGLGEHWLRAVCWDNGARLFGMNARGTPR